VGGMGEVYKVLHLHLNSIRVIKLMRAAIESDPGAHERFLREAQLATRIQSPHVAALYDFSTLGDDARYMVWEYIEGINLHELIQARGPLSPRYAATLAIQALHGLDAIHRAGIIHRDVSPENIMIAREAEGDERVKIIDLGIAKQGGEEGDNKTKTGMFVGKWKYCSPEHLGMLGEGERIDGRADLYSFGIVLYEMMTGVPPFQADTPHAFLVLHANERPRALREVNSSVTPSPELEAIIFRALEKDRAKRFPTAREFARALEALLPSLDDRAGAPPPLPLHAAVTEDPTRVTPADVLTVNSDPGVTMATLDLNSQATTVQTMGAQSVLARVEHVEQEVAREEKPRRSRTGLMAAVAAVLVIGGVVSTIVLRKPAPSATTTAMTGAAPVSTGTGSGRIGVNAYPWAEVRSIRNVGDGRVVTMDSPAVTPTPLDLAPGRYEITLSNPAFKLPITRTVDIRSGEEQMLTVEFADPSTARLPALGGNAQ
ncbi:MAG: serine/threonine-protein kinase, partial [Thermoanaerobaculia bacterium]